jgi:hypothetical protein
MMSDLNFNPIPSDINISFQRKKRTIVSSWWSIIVSSWWSIIVSSWWSIVVSSWWSIIVSFWWSIIVSSWNCECLFDEPATTKIKQKERKH